MLKASGGAERWVFTVGMEDWRPRRPTAGGRAPGTRRTHSGRVARPGVSQADQGKGRIPQRAEEW